MTHFKKQLSPALVISLIALFVALGGGAYAALGKNSIGAAQLRPSAVTTQKIRKAAVTGAKIKAGSVSRSKLSANAIGPSVVAFATLDMDGRVVPGESRGISQADVNGGYPLALCFKNLPNFRSAIVTPISDPLVQVTADVILHDGSQCAGNEDSQLEVDTFVDDLYHNIPPNYSQEAFTVALLR